MSRSATPAGPAGGKGKSSAGTRPEPRGLAALQGWFFSQIQPGARRGAGPVAGTPWLPARARVDIYAEMYCARLIAALAQEYPRLAHALGPFHFSLVAVEYLDRFPSRRPTIQDAGNRLPLFLRRELQAMGPGRYPYVADLAQLERVGSQVYVAAEEPAGEPVDAGLLRSTPAEDWPGLRFHVNPTLRIVRLGYRFPKGRKPVPGKVAYRVYRRDFDVYEAPMDTAEARALSLIARGRSFGEACVALGSAEAAASALASWIDEGLLRPAST